MWPFHQWLRFCYDLPAGAVKWEKVHLKKGQNITVCAADDVYNVPIKVGIEELDGTRKYDIDKNFVSFDYEIEKDGNYMVFVENSSRKFIQ